MGPFRSDLRAAWHSVRRSPLSALVIVSTLALAIGANTAIYTVAEGVLLEPLPYPEPQRMVRLLESNVEAGYPLFTVSAANLQDFRDQNQVFEHLAAARVVGLHLIGEGEAERLFGLMVSAEFFDVFNLPPLLGRPILASDDEPGAAKVVVLNHAFWQRRFGGDPGVVGRVLDLSGEPHQVVGVMSREFYPLERDFFVPLAIDSAQAQRGLHTLVGLARLKPGVPLATARADLETIAGRLAAAYPDTNAGWGAVVDPYHETLVRDVRPALLMLVAAVGLVLLIAGANAVNLMLARLATRQRDIAVRAALGASRRQLVRALLLESLLLTLAAGALGLVLAALGTRVLTALYAGDLPRSGNIEIDRTVLLYAVALSVVAGLAVGLVPALRASRPDLRAALAEGGGRTSGRRGRRLRQTLVLLEVALSFALLIGAGLLIRSFARLAAIDPGFDEKGALTARIELPPWRYGEEAERVTFYRQLFERLDRMPGVERAAAVSSLPVSQRVFAWEILFDGRPEPQRGEEIFARTWSVSPGYFGVMAIPLIEGRDFNPRDDENAQRVVVVNQAAAERFWPGESPIGKRIDITHHNQEEPIWWTVVGIVGDTRSADLAASPEPGVYCPFFQYPLAEATLVARSLGAPVAASGALREAVTGLDPALPVFDVRTLEALVADSVARPRFNAALLTTFAGLALVLSAIGVYGVISYGVTQRRREFGVRQALGARRREILALVLRQGMSPVMAGIVLGILGALAANRMISSLLFGVGAADPFTWVGVTALLLLVALTACWVPALRATRIDPWTALREE